MINKKFENKENGDVVVIRQDDGIWFTLTNGAKIKKDSFFNKYSEIIDPMEFFNNQGNVQNLAGKLEKVDPSKVQDSNQERTVRRVDETANYPDPYNNMAGPIDQKQQMIDEYNRNQKIKEQELAKYQQIDDDETAAKQLLENATTQRQKPIKSNDNPNYPEFDTNVKRDRDKSSPSSSVNDYYNENLYNQPPETPIVEDPNEESFKFFRGFKKNHKVTIELSFDEYIADPEFLKMMLNNFEADVIKYYTGEIFKNIANNPQKVEEEIYKQLEEMILGKKKAPTKRKPTTKRTKRVIPKVPKEDRAQIHEGVPEKKVVLPEVDPSKVKLSAEGVEPK